MRFKKPVIYLENNSIWMAAGTQSLKSVTLMEMVKLIFRSSSQPPLTTKSYLQRKTLNLLFKLLIQMVMEKLKFMNLKKLYLGISKET